MEKCDFADGGKGSGGQLEQMKNLECLQTSAASRSKCLSDLDAATKGYEPNSMAPSWPPSTYLRLHPADLGQSPDPKPILEPQP